MRKANKLRVSLLPSSDHRYWTAGAQRPTDHERHLATMCKIAGSARDAMQATGLSHQCMSMAALRVRSYNLQRVLVDVATLEALERVYPYSLQRWLNSTPEFAILFPTE